MDDHDRQPTQVTLPPECSTAIAAIAQVDGTPPDQLAGLIIADWITDHAWRFRAAVDAIDQLVGTTAPRPERVDYRVCGVCGERNPPDDASCHISLEEEDEDQEDEDDNEPLTCICGFTAAAPQGLGAHRRHCTTAKAAADPPRCANGCDRIAATRLGDGTACRNCYRTARISS